MEYGKLQGEIAAAAHIQFVGEIAPAAVVVGNPFNVVSATLIAAGTVGVLLKDGVDQLDCTSNVTCDTAPNTGTANNSGVDTDTLKQVLLVDAAGAPVSSGFYIVVVRTNAG